MKNDVLFKRRIFLIATIFIMNNFIINMSFAQINDYWQNNITIPTYTMGNVGVGTFSPNGKVHILQNRNCQNSEGINLITPFPHIRLESFFPTQYNVWYDMEGLLHSTPCGFDIHRIWDFNVNDLNLSLTFNPTNNLPDVVNSISFYNDGNIDLFHKVRIGGSQLLNFTNGVQLEIFGGDLKASQNWVQLIFVPIVV